MHGALRTALIILGLAVIIYLLLDAWQDSVIVSADSCRTSSGARLPLAVCRAIVDYRYQIGD